MDKIIVRTLKLTADESFLVGCALRAYVRTLNEEIEGLDIYSERNPKRAIEIKRMQAERSADIETVSALLKRKP